MILSINISEIVYILGVLILLFVIYRFMESSKSYRISKPYKWEAALQNKNTSPKLIKIERQYSDRVRFYNLWFQIERLNTNDIQGAFAELGVYKGETARAIHFMDEKRKLYLFDTFNGFSNNDLEHENQSDERFETNMFADTSLEKVKKYISGNDNIIFKAGLFPSTAKGLENELFAFVNIDADLYAPTIAALDFFYPRMSKGGVIIIHDYNHNWHGIPKAIDEFLQTIPESLLEIPDWQGSAMIIKNS